MEAIVEIKLRKTRSKNYDKAVRIMRTLPCYAEDRDQVSCRINDLLSFLKNRHAIDDLLPIILGWKFSEVFVYGERLKSSYYLNRFTQERTGKYFPLFVSNICEGDYVRYENLPYPFVHYPAYGGGIWCFSQDIDSELYLCECCRDIVENYIELRRRKPLTNYVGPKSYPLGADQFPMILANQSRNWNGELIRRIKFKPNLCFKCNHVVPKESYTHPMYGSIFVQKYGWYISQEYLRLGIDRYCLNNTIEEKVPLDIQECIQKYSTQSECQQVSSVLASIKRMIENRVRAQFGFSEIGESWASEHLLFQIVKDMFPEHEVIRHYRPQWLFGLELDIYLPSLRLAFEYQGIQHFKAVQHWGGEEKLSIQREHDSRKVELCKKESVTLICVNYDDPLDSDYVRMKVSEYIKK